MPLVLPFVGVELTGRVENVAAVWSYAMDMVADSRETALLERAGLGFHEFLEAIAGQLLVLDVIGLVLVCKKRNEEAVSVKVFRISWRVGEFQRYKTSASKQW